MLLVGYLATPSDSPAYEPTAVAQVTLDVVAQAFTDAAPWVRFADVDRSGRTRVKVNLRALPLVGDDLTAVALAAFRSSTSTLRTEPPSRRTGRP